ncbi:MAG: 4Fe-4S binding protein, partial [Anaerolineae bacterium]|nr:4Fe-4S binding protein [Anaerolineae bacterium]
EIFELPPAMIPHIDFVVTEQEMALVVGLDDKELTVSEIAAMMGMGLDEAQAFVTRAFHRGVIAKAGVAWGHEEDDGERGPDRYKAGTFYRRLDPLAMYEGWGDVPADARDAVIEWQLQEFIDIWQDAITAMLENPDARVRVPNRDYMLLEEALDMVDAADDFVVVPCDCRAIVRACDRPLDVCVRLNRGATMTLEHGHGRRVTKDEMKRIVIDADRAGLMHTGNRFWKETGEVFGFCNCCACDCYPIRAGIKLDMWQAWPRIYYVAERDLDTCIQCGTCAERCHFGAFYKDDAGAVLFDAGKCRGCGICATACPEAAITMRPLREEEVPA